MTEMHSSVVSPKGVWWRPANQQEKLWVTLSFIWCLIMFVMMPFWHMKGGQNPSGIRTKVTPSDFQARVDRFISDYQVGEEKGFPIVEPPPGSEVYLLGGGWRWYPILKLKSGAKYTLHLSSTDYNHGFSLYPLNINFQVVPGYDYGLEIIPNTAGDFRILCNEFCGIGHHLMVGKVIVE